MVNAAIDAGYDATQILKYLLARFPAAQKQVKRALYQGYTAQQILNHLQRKKGKGKIGEESLGMMTPHEQAQASDEAHKKSAAKTLGKTALTAAAVGGFAARSAYGAFNAAQAARRAAPEILPALAQKEKPLQLPNLSISAQQRQIPYHPTPPFQKPPDVIHPPYNGPSGKPPLASPSPDFPETIAQPNYVELPASMKSAQEERLTSESAPRFDQNKVEEELDNLGVLRQVKNIGPQNTPEQVGRLIRFIAGPKKSSEFEKKFNDSVENVLQDYLASQPETHQKQSEKKRLKEVEEEPFDESSYREEHEYRPVEKGSVVMLLDGNTGTVENVKQGIAEVKSGDVVRRKKEGDLIHSALPPKELHELYDDLIKGIQTHTGEEVSRNVFWAGYSPETNELAVVHHLGPLYVYNDISKQEAQELTSLLSKRKSTGENYIGAWASGTKSPIGAKMHQLISKLQRERGGKGKEYKQKYGIVYDALEPAKSAAREEYEKRKKADRESKISRKTKKSKFD